MWNVNIVYRRNTTFGSQYEQILLAQISIKSVILIYAILRTLKILKYICIIYILIIFDIDK